MTVGRRPIATASTAQDQRRSAALFNGAPRLAKALNHIAPRANIQAVIRAIFAAHDAAMRMDYVRDARPVAYRATVAVLSACDAEARAILARRRSERTASVLVIDAMRIAMARKSDALPADAIFATAAWASEDRRRLAELRRRSVTLRAARDALHGAGRAPTPQRLFAERLAPIFTGLTGRPPTVSTPPDTEVATPLGDFPDFIAAAADLVGLPMPRTLLLSVSREIARRAPAPIG
jgi:hypothetical protein